MAAREAKHSIKISLIDSTYLRAHAHTRTHSHTHERLRRQRETKGRSYTSDFCSSTTHGQKRGRGAVVVVVDYSAWAWLRCTIILLCDKPTNKISRFVWFFYIFLVVDENLGALFVFFQCWDFSLLCFVYLFLGV